MKKFKFALLAFMTALISFGFTACSDDDDLKDVSVTGITITPTTLTLKTGTTGTLTATVVPENAAVTTVAWSSSDTNVATVENGVARWRPRRSAGRRSARTGSGMRWTGCGWVRSWARAPW